MKKIILYVLMGSVFIFTSACKKNSEELAKQKVQEREDEIREEVVNIYSAEVTENDSNSSEAFSATENDSNSLGAFSATEIRDLSVPEFDTEGQISEEVNFISANVMTFQTISIEEFLDNMIIGDIEANNIGNDILTDIKIYVSILDVSGIERGMGEASCEYAAEIGKKVSVSGIFDVDRKIATHIKVTAYEYTIHGQKYHINLINEEAVKWNVNEGTSNFKEKNILSFSFDVIGVKNDSYKYNTIIQNNSDRNITVVECRIVLLDSNNNQLHETNQYTRNLLANSSNTELGYTSSLDLNTLSKISKLGVVSYSYWFDDVDVEGNKGYKINMINETATGLGE